ncbi:DUF2207 domain-containing protein [Wohlfahrtiimonas chitiniclastica]|uniref:DUF2207 domain-containing protein n=1 Tax=Wohlfahrtiimonas chitiniclastica TaxID=400946 RepID=UPI000A683D2D|nr:DUF2207 domain-containing protein [Wohlfahrtiimonas chitiniclastica]
MIRKIFQSAWMIVCLLAVAYGDHIENYHVTVHLTNKGNIDVKETITIETDHEEVRRGIVRDIPTGFQLLQKPVETPVKVRHVLRDGRSEPYTLEHYDGGLRILTGAAIDDPSHYLPKGKHTFVIEWRSDHHVRSLKDYDELYLNVIGQQWTLPITHASATLYLPRSVSEIQSAAYYGGLGSQNAADVEVISPHEINFSVPVPLKPHEGLTIATGFTAGIIHGVEPDWTDLIMARALHYLPNFMQPVNVVFLILLVLMSAWFVGGRLLLKMWRGQQDDNMRYAPPDGLTLEEMFYLGNDPIDPPLDRAALALLVDLHQKGALTMDGYGNIERLPESNIHGRLESAEQQLLHDWHDQDAKGLRGAIQSLRGHLIHGFDYFYTPKMKFYVGFGLAIIAGVMALATLYLQLEIFMSLIFMAIAAVKLIRPVIMDFLMRDQKDEDEQASWILCGFGAIFGGLPLYATQEDWLPKPLTDAEFILMYLCVLIPVVLIMMMLLSIYERRYVLRPQYAEAARAVKGFQRFLAERNPTGFNLTPDLFEHYLPHAILLGVDNDWLNLYQTAYPQNYADSSVVGSGAFFAAANQANLYHAPARNVDNDHGLGGSNNSGGGASGSGGGGSAGGGSGGGGGSGR